jgi:hypothetical protein
MLRKKKQEMQTRPQVGIFFFFDHKLLIECTPLEQAGNWGKFKIHEDDHVAYWDRLIREGVVPRHEDYKNIPRGRVALNTATGRYLLLLDRCILRQKRLVATIKQKMGLPPNETDTDTDAHYRCAKCLAERGLG